MDDSPIKNGIATRDIKAGEEIEIPAEELAVIAAEHTQEMTLWRALAYDYMFKRFRDSY